MPTPTTADIRTWARHQGLTVAERGRLAPTVLAAYAAAHKKPAKPAQAASAKAAVTNAPAEKAAPMTTRPKKRPAKRTAPAGQLSARSPVTESPIAPASSSAPALAAPPTRSPELVKIELLEKDVAALAARVAALEVRKSEQKRFARKG